MSKARSGLASDRRIYDCHYTPAISSTSDNNSTGTDNNTNTGTSVDTGIDSRTGIGVVSGTGSVYNGTMTQVTIPGSLSDTSPMYINLTLNNGDVPIPMAGMIFNFFGTNYSNNLYWSSNNALIFGTPVPELEVNISRDTVPAILLGNYDRLLEKFYYKNISTTNYSMTVLLVHFWEYYMVGFPYYTSAETFEYQIRLIKEKGGSQRQFVEVYVVYGQRSICPGYSTGISDYPPRGIYKFPEDSNGNAIDSTKHSPFNITNGTNFLNPCGTTYSTVSPATNTSFVFSSDSTGTSWVFTNNAYVNV
jgi:hypothetical protein